MASEGEVAAPLVSQIVEEFATFGVTLSDEVASQCLLLCAQYGVDGEQLAVLWLSFATTNGYDTISLEALEHLDRLEQSSVKRKASAAAASANNSLNMSVDNGRLALPDDEDDEDLLEAYGGGSGSKTERQAQTPKSTKSKQSNGQVRSISAQFHSTNLSPTVASPSVRYSSRTNSGAVVASYGASENITWTAKQSFQPEVQMLQAFEDEPPLTKPYKYMYQSAQTIGDVLNERILSMADEMQDVMLNKGKEGEEEEYASIGEINSGTFSTVGRICCDCSGHLNAASVLVEGWAVPGRSNCVPLDLSRVESFSIFPGQIVGIKGMNSVGSKIIAQELVQGKTPPDPSSPITISINTGPVQVVVACGPFTTSSNLLYEPLTDFLTTLRDNPPHVLILLGPFLDASHPLVVGNDLGESHNAVFNRCLRIIASTLEGTGTRIVLVSSSRDVTSPMVYPTPPYDVSGNFTCVSDPALISIEGVVVALTSTDILLHLGKEEISFPSPAPDRLGRLARHILKQRSFYPLYPAHESMCVGMEQLENHAHLPSKPHLLVIPSDLRYFARDLEGCVAVNPERLAKGITGGTYARIELHPPNSSKGMHESINVNILRV